MSRVVDVLDLNEQMKEHICFNQDTSNHQHVRECLVCKVCFPILLDEWLI